MAGVNLSETTLTQQGGLRTAYLYTAQYSKLPQYVCIWTYETKPNVKQLGKVRQRLAKGGRERVLSMLCCVWSSLFSFSIRASLL